MVQTGVKAKDQSAAPDATPLTIPARSQLQSTFAKIAKELEPSVVNISVEFGVKPTPQASNRSGRRGGQRLQPSNPDNGATTVAVATAPRICFVGSLAAVTAGAHRSILLAAEAKSFPQKRWVLASWSIKTATS